MPEQASGLLSPFLVRRRVAAVAPLLQEGRVLDFGCGGGGLASVVPPDRYLGVDRDPDALDLARTRYPQHRFLNPAALEAAPETEFDVIASLAMIEHLPDPELWLRSLHGNLREGGRVVLTTPHPWSRVIHDTGARVGLFSCEAQEEHETFLGPQQIETLARAAGLELVTARRFLFGVNQLFVLTVPAAGP